MDAYSKSLPFGADPGEHIFNFAERMVKFRKESKDYENCTMIAIHNDIAIIVESWMTASDIESVYNVLSDIRYLRHRQGTNR